MTKYWWIISPAIAAIGLAFIAASVAVIPRDSWAIQTFGPFTGLYTAFGSMIILAFVGLLVWVSVR